MVCVGVVSWYVALAWAAVFWEKGYGVGTKKGLQWEGCCCVWDRQLILSFPSIPFFLLTLSRYCISIQSCWGFCNYTCFTSPTSQPHVGSIFHNHRLHQVSRLWREINIQFIIYNWIQYIYFFMYDDIYEKKNYISFKY